MNTLGEILGFAALIALSILLAVGLGVAIARIWISRHPHEPSAKPLKTFRSHAERMALWQRNIQIALTALALCTNLLVALKVFGIIK
jgi:hypothetical protein